MKKAGSRQKMGWAEDGARGGDSCRRLPYFSTSVEFFFGQRRWENANLLSQYKIRTLPNEDDSTQKYGLKHRPKINQQ